MAQTYILLLLLLLWNNVESSLTNQVCSRLPTFEHGFVSDEYKKVQYQQGDVIYFSCNPGYTTGFNVSYICTERGWKETTNGNCVDERTFQLPLGCLPPPALKNGQILYFNYFYADGDQATFKCDPDYKMTGQPFKICKNGQWTGDTQCEEVSCELPSSNSEDPVVRVAVGTRVTVQCERGGSSKQVQCLPSGWWDSPFCPVKTCKVTPGRVGPTFSPANHFIFAPGEHVTATCPEDQWVRSREFQSVELTCLDTGEWNFSPICRLVTCDKNAANVQWWENNYYRHISNIHESVRYTCIRGYDKSPTGRATCRREGWDPNPLCKAKGCAKLSVNNAEITSNSKEIYEHLDTVHFQCTHDTSVTFMWQCYFGEWTSSTRPARPCRAQHSED